MRYRGFNGVFYRSSLTSQYIHNGIHKYARRIDKTIMKFKDTFNQQLFVTSANNDVTDNPPSLMDMYNKVNVLLRAAKS